MKNSITQFSISKVINLKKNFSVWSVRTLIGITFLSAALKCVNPVPASLVASPGELNAFLSRHT